MRYRQNPVIFLLNNDGYQVERAIYDNAVQRPPDVGLRSDFPRYSAQRRGIRASTERELETALALAENRRDSLVFIEVRLDRLDFSETLRGIGERLR